MIIPNISYDRSCSYKLLIIINQPGFVIININHDFIPLYPSSISIKWKCSSCFIHNGLPQNGPRRNVAFLRLSAQGQASAQILAVVVGLDCIIYTIYFDCIILLPTNVYIYVCVCFIHSIPMNNTLCENHYIVQ
jgi:hypothetical protein